MHVIVCCLSGDDIRLEARILSVADVVEAMSSHRPYRPALGLECALEEIKRGRGFLYDTNVANACLKILGDNDSIFNRIMTASDHYGEYIYQMAKEQIS